MVPTLNTANTLLYDGSFEGLLSAVFETYRLGLSPVRIVAKGEWQDNLFDEVLEVDTRLNWAERIKKGVIKRCSPHAFKMLYRCFHTEQPDIEMLIYRFIKKSVESRISIEENYSDDVVLRLHQLNKKMGREIHRMHAFVRFQRTKDDIYYAAIEPDFNVLPFIINHFEGRYADQKWLIYDIRRRYGMFYDESSTNTVTFPEALHHQISANRLHSEELPYQKLWRGYFKSTTITERRNMKLHLQHVPRRYWKLLTEKQGKLR